jgi:iron complex outermembrane recepter protein
MSFKLKPVARNLALAFGGAASIAVLALPAYAQQTPAQQPQRLDRIEITGTHIRRVDAEGPQPVVTITRDDIERSGKTTLTELITALPVASGGTFTESVNAGNSFAPGTAAVSLRGLGATRSSCC